MIYNSYEKKILKYIIQHGEIKTGYEVANENKNLGNDNLYNKAIRSLEKKGLLIKQKEKWIPSNYIQNMLNSFLGDFFKLNTDYMIDNCLTNKKMTFYEWLEGLCTLFKKLEQQGVVNAVEKEYKDEDIDKILEELKKKC